MYTKLMALFAMMLMIVPGFAQVSADVQGNANVNTNLASIEADTSVKAGVTPDNPIWGLEVALDRLSLLLTFSANAKAEKGLSIASERVAEAQLMLEKQLTAQARAAMEAHAETMEVTSDAVASISGPNVETSLHETIQLRQKLEAEQEIVASLPETVKIKLQAQGASAEIQNDAEMTLNSMSSNTSRVRAKIEAKENEIKIEAQARGVDVSKVLSEIDATVNVELKARADARIKEAIQAIAKAKSGVSATASSAVLISNAEAKLKTAQDAYVQGNYGMAYGQATAAMNIALSAVRVHVETNTTANANEGISVSVKSNIQLSADVMNAVSKLASSLKGVSGETELDLRVEKQNGNVQIDAKVEGQLNADQQRLWSELQSAVRSVVQASANADAEVQVEIKHRLKTNGAQSDVNVEIRGGVTTVRVVTNTGVTVFTLNTTDLDQIYAEIAARLNVSVSEVKARARVSTETSQNIQIGGNTGANVGVGAQVSAGTPANQAAANVNIGKRESAGNIKAEFNVGQEKHGNVRAGLITGI